MTTAMTNQRGLELMRTQAARAPMLTADDEVRLARAAATGDDRARDALVRAHLRLVLSIAATYGRHSSDQEDLIGEGMLGLVNAINRFDPDRGVRLAAYAAWWIRAYVRRYTIVNRRIVRPPSTRNSRKVMAHLRSVQRELTQRDGVAPDADAVADALQVKRSDVDEMEHVLQRADLSLGATPDGTTVDLPSTDATPEADLITHDERRWASTVIGRAMANLSQRERAIFTERSLQDTPDSLAAMGQRLGLSRERVRQIHEHGFQKVRQAVLSSVA